MGIVNFWVIYELENQTLAQVESLLPPLRRPNKGTARLRTHLRPSEGAQRDMFVDVGQSKLRSLYRRYGDLSDIVSLREGLQDLEQSLPDLYAVGMWDYHTGEPIGGAGSPWFLTPSWVAEYTQGGQLEDVCLMSGQAKRSFV